jgi:hypothetical protein
MAQWAVDDCRQHRSSAMEGNARWTAVAIMMDGGGVIAMDGSCGNEKQRSNGWQDGKAITMDNGMAVARWMAQWTADNHKQMRGQRWEQCLVFVYLIGCEIWAKYKCLHA